MRYLTIWGDYRSTGVRDDYQGPLTRDDLTISDELWTDLQDWVSKYAFFTLTGTGITTENASEVRNLDLIGLALARRMTRELQGTAKVGYFSEALLQNVVDETHLDKLLALL